MRALVDGDRRRFARDASALLWLVDTLRPLLMLSVCDGLALFNGSQLDRMRVERGLRSVLERAPGLGAGPEPEQ